MRRFLKNAAFAAVASIALAFAATPSHAAAITGVYTSEASFKAALAPGYAFDNFNDLHFADIEDASTVTRPYSPFGNGTYSSSTTLFAFDGSLGTYWAGSSLTVTFSNPNIKAFGAQMFPTDPFDHVQHLINIEVWSGPTMLLGGAAGDFFTVPGVDDFRGFTADAPITSVTLSYIRSSEYWLNFDNVYVGGVKSAAAPAVPLPAAATAALPLLSLTAIKRRRRRGA